MAVRRPAALTPSAQRPRPPAELLELSFEHAFAPAPDLAAWVRSTFLEEGGDLHNPEHRHLVDAELAFLWAGTGYTRRGRRVLGLTEDVAQSLRGNAWQTGRAEQQLRGWFGQVPKFLITIDAVYAAECTDLELCALIEHELYHVGHQLDEFGVPKFGKDGRPKLGIRGHDVEEFVGVVARYGVGDPDGYLGQMILAAAMGPTVAPIRIAQACGTCLLRAA